MAGKKASRGPVRIALAGLGRIGWGYHAQEIMKRPDFKLAAVIDPDANRLAEARKKVPDVRTYTDWKNFLKESGDIDLAIVATATTMHTAMTIEALQAGLNVLCEKPMALNVKDADRMIAAARKAGRMLTIHQNWRTQAHQHHLVSIMDSGILGRVFLIKKSLHQFSRRNDWQCFRRLGGGALNNHGAHQIDTALVVLQSPVVDVWGDLQRTVNPGDAEDHFKVVLRGRNGRVVDVEYTGACAIPQPRWLVMGSLGTLIEENGEFVIKYLDPAKLKKLKADPRPVPFGVGYGVYGGETLEFQEKRVKADAPEFEVDFYGKLLETLRNGKKPWVTPESVREQLRVLSMARQGTGFEVK
jgi:scyllo-inositol 2-dehydrogenase (NADP+)